MFDNPFVSDTSLGGAFHPSLRLDAKKGELFTVDPGGPGQEPRRATVSVGTLIVVDFGATLVGGVIFKPKFAEKLVPLGAPMPPFPQNEAWQMATRLQVVVDGHGGLRTWLLTGKIILRQMAQLRILYTYHADAARGLIPIYRLTDFAPAQTDYGTFYGPVFEPVGLTERDEATFGPRVCPPPPPILPSSDVRPVLPAPAPTDEAETAEPKSEPVEPKSEATDSPPSPPDQDRFASWRPISVAKKPGSRKPY